MFRFSYASFLVLAIIVSLEETNATAQSQLTGSKAATKQVQYNTFCTGRDGQNGRDGRDGRDGIQGVKGVQGDKGIKGDEGKIGPKGPRGERGIPGTVMDGAHKFSDTADNCTQRTEGTVRYDTFHKTLQLCNGSTWLSLLTGESLKSLRASGKGSHSNPGRHCLDILNSGGSRGNGLYWIDPNGGSTDDLFQAFCDMETESGGWTLVATKVFPILPSIIEPVFSTLAAKTTDSNAGSHIHPSMRDWKEVMFRFADVSTIRVIYNRKAGAPQKDKEEFDKFLMGKNVRLIKNVFGFYKYSPADHKRSPTSGFVTINSLYFNSNRGIMESHGGSDKWLDVWSHADGSNNYIFSDDRRARGTKCIAGYCYLNKPIWLMVR